MSLNIVMDTNIYLFTKFKGDTSSLATHHNIYASIDPPPLRRGFSMQEAKRLS